MTSLKTIFGLAWLNLKNNKVRTLLVAFSVSLGVAVLFFFLSFVAGVEKFLLNEITQNLDPRQLIVSYDYKNAGFFQVEKDEALRIDKSVIAEIGQISGVQEVAPQLVLKIPVKLEIDFWDKFFETDVPVYGMDFNFLKIDSIELEKGNLPVVISERLLDVYNTSLAESTGLPRLSKEGLLGRKIDIIFGQSSFFTFNSEKIKRMPAKVAALSKLVPVVGITIPLHEAEKIVQEFQNINSDELKYSALYLQTEDATKNTEIQAQIEEMGFRVFSLQEAQKSLNQLIWYVKKLIQIIGGLVLFIALFSVSMTLLMSVMERKQEIGILRSLGMQKMSVSLLVLIEGFLVGFFAYFLGMLIALVSIKLTDSFLLKLTPNVSFKPISFFSLELSQAFVVFGFILFFVLIASYFPARKASKLDPLEALLK